MQARAAIEGLKRKDIQMRSKWLNAFLVAVVISILTSCSDAPNTPGVDRSKLDIDGLCPGITWDLYPVSSSWQVCGWATHNNTPPYLYQALDEAYPGTDGDWIFKGPQGDCQFTLGFTQNTFSPASQVVLGVLTVHIYAEATSQYGDDFGYEIWMDNANEPYPDNNSDTPPPVLEKKTEGSFYVTAGSGTVEKDVIISGWDYLRIKRINSLVVKIHSSAVPRIHAVSARAWGYVPGKNCDDPPVFTEP